MQKGRGAQETSEASASSAATAAAAVSSTSEDKFIQADFPFRGTRTINQMSILRANFGLALPSPSS